MQVRRRRAGLVGGPLLTLLGLLLVAIQLWPGVEVRFLWPWVIVGLGLFLLLIGSATGSALLAIPATIVAGIGGILYYQTATGDWDSWAYVWSLIPGFVGVGVILFSLMGDHGSGLPRAGGSLILISVILFALFGSLFGALGFMGDYWPALLMLLGLILLVWPLLRLRQ